MSLGVGHEDIPQRNGHEANRKPSVQDLSRCQHRFHTDTSPERYHSQAAKEAWVENVRIFSRRICTTNRFSERRSSSRQYGNFAIPVFLDRRRRFAAQRLLNFCRIIEPNRSNR
jgi:hypothetical protein